MADINVPVVGKVSQKAAFGVALAGVAMVAFLIYRHASVSQKSNMGRVSYPNPARNNHMFVEIPAPAYPRGWRGRQN